MPHRIRYEILALGAQMKSSFCFVKDSKAYLWGYGGDLSNLENLKSFEGKIKKAQRRLKAEPKVIACDLHPEYISTKLADEWGRAGRLKVVSIQHHKAHVASCIIDNNIKGRVIGLAFDGTGFGLDGKIWGGEFFAGTLGDLKRVAHLRYIPMPGGEGSVRESWRMALSYIYNIYRERFRRLKVGFLSRFDEGSIRLLTQIIDKDINSPMTSSMGRLFDAVSAIAGICGTARYEGQAAIELEKAIRKGSRLNGQDRYNFGYKDQKGEIIIDWSNVIKGVVKDSGTCKSKQEVPLRFHNAICHMIKDVCRLLRKKYKIDNVCMSGGVFQNKYLVQNTPPLLRQQGFRVYLHKGLPAHDGNIALGQAVLAGS